MWVWMGENGAKVKHLWVTVKVLERAIEVHFPVSDLPPDILVSAEG